MTKNIFTEDTNWEIKKYILKLTGYEASKIYDPIQTHKITIPVNELEKIKKDLRNSGCKNFRKVNTYNNEVVLAFNATKILEK